MDAERDGADSSLPQPGRLWTVEEANGHLDELRELLPQLRAWVVRLRKVHEELQRLAAFWGKEIDASDHPDLELKHRLDVEWTELTARLEEHVARLQADGIEVKDLESGLLDFYGLQNGEVVFLCWQRGEDEVGFYHTLDGGYRTRRPLPPTTPTAAPSGRGPSA
jgi:hypothetical protein